MHPILFHLGDTPVHTYGVMGAVGFLVAAFIVRELPIEWLRWGVVVVVLYAAFLLLRSAFSAEKPAAQATPVTS